ncbi:TPA: phenylalanine--tRNA ligase subunit beta [bacterium]|nr:phenylalanine--tRNA ligase subunit beta [bacterium]
MKISYNWLKSFVHLPNVEELCDILTMLGFEVAQIEKEDSDTTIDLEIPVSRHDALSIIGIARDISAKTNEKLNIPDIPEPPITLDIIPEIKIDEPLLCPRYTGRIISNVSIFESPDWIKEKLIKSGIRPINNIVDITNYVLLEFGHPMHSFDYDKLEGGIVIRRAKNGEKIIGLDEREYVLDEKTLVIADSKKPVCIGGVIGGIETEVTDKTKNIFLEVAYFDPITVRETSKMLNITTESSYRFERMTDYNGVILVQNRTTNLILELIPDAKASSINDVYPNPYPLKKILLRPDRVNKVLGIDLSKEKQKEILERLCFKIEVCNGNFIVEVPSFRGEITREIDLIEEIARVYGYEKIKEAMPISPVVPDINGHFNMVKKVKEIMTGCGMDEVITYSFTNKDALEKIGQNNFVSLLSPLSSETSLMTTSLIPSLLDVFQGNKNRQKEDLSIFSIGNVFKKGPSEHTSLAGLMSGKKKKTWLDEERKIKIFDLLGVIKRLFSEMGIDCSFEKKDVPWLKHGLKILADDKEIGISGILDETCIFEIDLDMLISLRKTKVFSPLAKYPKIDLDLSLVAKEETKSSDIEEIIREKGRGLVLNIELYDIYKRKNIKQGYKSLTYTITYQSDERTLTMDEVEEIRDDTLKELKKIGVSLRE